MSQPIELLKQKTDSTLETITEHNHDERYSKLEHNHDDKYATIDTEQTLTNKTLTEPKIEEPTIISQTLTLGPTGITNTTITLPAYSTASSYTLLTSQDVEAYKTKYVIEGDNLKLKAQGFGLSHLYWKLDLESLTEGEPWSISEFFTELSVADGESSCATGFLLDTAEPYTVKFVQNKLSLTLPLKTHTIEAGTYILDTLLPTPPSGWIESRRVDIGGVTIGVVGHETSDGNAGQEDGNIEVSYQGHFLSWDSDETTNGSIKVKRVR